MPASSIAAEGGDPDRTRVEQALAAALTDRLRLTTTELTLEELCERAGIVAPATATATV